MTKDLLQLRSEVGSAFATKARRLALATRYTKIVLLSGGTLVAGAAAAFGTGPLWPISIVQICGLFGVLLAFIGGFYVAFVEDDSAHALEISRQSLDGATDLERQVREMYSELLEWESATNRLQSLYTAFSAARGAVEQGISTHVGDDVELVSACLKTMKTNLRVALGFSLTDYWTVSVYKTVVDEATNVTMLKCIAHDRALDCELKDARTWRIGIGVGGISLAKNDEVVVPDLADDKVGTAFRLEKAAMKEHDSKHYRSLFAVPINVGDDKIPWGVAMATSNQPSHFGMERPKGVKPEEAVRALAGISALAVSACRNGRKGGETVENQVGRVAK